MHALLMSSRRTSCKLTLLHLHHQLDGVLKELGYTKEQVYKF
jgi:hypothetical protein